MKFLKKEYLDNLADHYRKLSKDSVMLTFLVLAVGGWFSSGFAFYLNWNIFATVILILSLSIAFIHLGLWVWFGNSRRKEGNKEGNLNEIS